MPEGRGVLGALHEVHSTLRASAWAALVARVVLFAVGLVVLAWIGRVATAAPIAPTGTQLVTARVDAGSFDSLVSPASAAASAPPPLSAIAVSGVALAPSTLVAVAAPSSTPAPSGSRATPEDPVFVNHASAEQLRRLPGVGPKRAEAIVALRQRVGRFQRVEDLLRVKGVGRTTLRKWRPLVRLDAPPTPIPPDGAERPDGGHP